jgi:hypothetical protein
MSGIKDPIRRKEADRKYRERNRQSYQELRRFRRQRLKEHVRKFKDKPCADCRESYPYYVMDFDHRPGRETVRNCRLSSDPRGLDLRQTRC